MDEALKERNARLLYTYGWTAERYDAELDRQGGGCACCGRLPKNLRLHVEHDHKVAKTKIVLSRGPHKAGWWATVLDFGVAFHGASRRDAGRQAKRFVLAKSVRGIVCWHCNSLIKKASDDPAVLRNASVFLDKFYTQLYNV